MGDPDTGGSFEIGGKGSGGNLRVFAGLPKQMQRVGLKECVWWHAESWEIRNRLGNDG